MRPIPLGAFGARGDCVTRTAGGAVTAGATDFTSSNGGFTANDVGKRIYIKGATTGGGVLSTTIAAVTSASTITLATPAQVTVTSAQHYWGTDDTAAIQFAVNSRLPVEVGRGFYLTGPITWPSLCYFQGLGPGISEFVLKAGAPAGSVFSLANLTTELINVGGFSIDGKRGYQSNAVAGITLASDPDGSNQTAASFYGSNDPALNINLVQIYDTSGDGLVTTGRGSCRTSRVRAYRCAGHGFNLGNYDSFYDNLESGGSGLNGIFLQAGGTNNRLTNFKSFYSGQIDRVTSGDGLVVRGYGNQISNGEIQNAGRRGVMCYNTIGISIANVLVEFPSNPVTVNDGVYLLDVTNSIFQFVIRDPTASGLSYGLTLQKTLGGNVGNIITATVIGAVTGAYRLTNGQTIDTNRLVLTGQQAVTLGP